MGSWLQQIISLTQNYKDNICKYRSSSENMCPCEPCAGKTFYSAAELFVAGSHPCSEGFFSGYGQFL